MTSPARRTRRRGAIWLVAAALAIVITSQAHANFLTFLREAAEIGHVATRGAAKVGAMGSIEAGAFLRKLPRTPGVEARAVTGTHGTGFALTTLEGQPQVFSRVDDLAAALTRPPARGAKAELFVSEATLFDAQAAFRTLPDLDNVRIVVKSGQSYPLRRTAQGFAIEPQLNLVLNFSNASQLSEGFWRTYRPFNRSSLRLVVADDAAAGSLGAVRPDLIERAITVERISATNPAQSLSGMRGQTVVVFGRIEDGAIVTPRGGARLKLDDLQAAATRADLDVIVLGTDVPGESLLRRMIGGETPAKIDIGARTESFAGLINELGARNTKFAIDATADGVRRTRIEARPVVSEVPTSQVPSSQAPSSQVATGAATDVTVRLLTHPAIHSARTFTRSQAEQTERDERIFPSVPAWVHQIVLANLVLGLLAWPFSVAFFDRAWHKPAPSRPLAYRMFYRLVFLVVFLPLAGALCFLAAMLLIVFFLVIAPFRWIWRKLNPTPAA